MDTPQALQHDYCFYFGTNMLSRLPRRVCRQLPDPLDRPLQYMCDKGVGELDDREIQAVQAERLKLARRIRWEVDDAENHRAFNETLPPADESADGYDSVLHISTRLYQAAGSQFHTPEDNAMITFLLATTMCFTVAHAAHYHLFGDDYQNFRETSLIAKAGLEWESRIFGATSNIRLDALLRGFWSNWQVWPKSAELGRVRSRYRSDLDEHESNYGKIDAAFVMKLCGDEFWSGEYVRRGARALVPKAVAKACCCVCGEENSWVDEEATKANLLIPLSIRDLFRDGGPSYAKRWYSGWTNPGLVLRSDQDISYESGSSDDGDETSDGDSSSDSGGSSEEDEGDGEEGGVVGEGFTEDETSLDSEDISDDEDEMSIDGEEGGVDEDAMNLQFLRERLTAAEDEMDVDDVEEPDDSNDEDWVNPDEDDGNEDRPPQQTGNKRSRKDRDDSDDGDEPPVTKRPATWHNVALPHRSKPAQR